MNMVRAQTLSVGGELCTQGLTYSQLVDGAIDKALDVWKEKVGPALKQAKGFKGAYVIGNPNTGKGV
jgi:hypothetical protein